MDSRKALLRFFDEYVENAAQLDPERLARAERATKWFWSSLRQEEGRLLENRCYWTRACPKNKERRKAFFRACETVRKRLAAS